MKVTGTDDIATKLHCLSDTPLSATTLIGQQWNSSFLRHNKTELYSIDSWFFCDTLFISYFAALFYEIALFTVNVAEVYFMNDHTYTPQRRERFREGMLCMYRERLQFCQEEFMAASEICNVEYMHEMRREMKSLWIASLALITEGQGLRCHPHLRLLPHQ